MYLLKKKNRSLKTLLSIGGYTYSQDGQFEPMLASESTRSIFARSAVQKMFDLGFDGLSLDYEYVSSPVECRQMIDLLKKIRTAMESYAKSTNSAPFIISYASPAGATNYMHLDMPAMDKYIDQWDFMAYDYAGTWDTTSGHSSNLFANAEHSFHTPYNTESAMDYYINVGKIAPEKINLGLPLYGHVFVQTQGPGSDYDKAASLQEGDKGNFLYKDIPAAANVVELPELGASYSYDAGKEYMVSYDTPNIARQKAKWIKEKGLGGAMFWEVSGDKTGDDSLVATVIKELGKLEKSKNHLSYPESQYENIKNGVKGEGEEVNSQDVGKEDDEAAESASQKAEESKEATTEVGTPTSTSTSIPIPKPTIAKVEVAESTPTVTATAVSTFPPSTFYSVYGAGPTLIINSV
jgi:chitinase